MVHAVTWTTWEAQSNASMGTACRGLLRQLSEPPDQRHIAHTPPHLQQVRSRSSPVAHVSRASASHHRGKPHLPTARADWREYSTKHDDLTVSHPATLMAGPRYHSRKHSFARLLLRHRRDSERCVLKVLTITLPQQLHGPADSPIAVRTGLLSSRSSNDGRRLRLSRATQHCRQLNVVLLVAVRCIRQHVDASHDTRNVVTQLIAALTLAACASSSPGSSSAPRARLSAAVLRSGRASSTMPRSR